MTIQIDSGKPDLGDKSPIVGIDLGTTNSLVAIVVGGTPQVLVSREGRRLVPSIVSLVPGQGGEPVVGYAARANKVRDAEHTVFSAKRLLGRGFDELQAVAHQLPYKLVAPAAGDAGGAVRMQLGDRAYTAIEISAMILRELKASAEHALGCRVERAVITVPAYFNDSQRQATRAAGRLAGLDVLRIINEPTAASLAYGLDRKKQGLIAVYDLGGGTFDVSILKLHDGIFEVLATHGDTQLGGDDIDRALADVVLAEIRAAHGDAAAAGNQLLASVLEAVEAAKIRLSEHADAQVRLAVPGSGGGGEYARAFTRAELERLARPIVERTREPCLRALADAGLKLEDLSDVVLVGGPTRLAVVQAVAREIFGREPNTSVHPDEVVAAGAAIQADILAGNNRDFLLLDVVPLSLGIETYGGLMATLIPRNTRIPAVAREGFTTFVDNQTAVDVHVLQGERDRATDNRSLARFKLRGIPAMPASMPRIEVSFLIDADGILQVSARDQLGGSTQTIEVKPSFGLTDEEVEKMLLATMDNAEADILARRLIEARNEAETVLRTAEKKMPDALRLLPKPDADKLQAGVERLRGALAAEDLGLIRQASRDLSQSSLRLVELLIVEAGNNARGGTT